jgi:hypothetical protein
VLTRAIYLEPEAFVSKRTVDVVLVTAFLLSIVHYVDNTVRFDDYTPDPGLITRPLIPLAWVVFTAFGVWGYLQYRRGDDRKAAVGLAVYSVSGLIGPLHFTEVSPSDFDWFQNLFVVLDTLAGVAVFAIACTLALRSQKAGVVPG